MSETALEFIERVIPDPLRWYVLTDAQEPIEGQRAYEMLESEAASRNRIFREVHSRYRWTVDWKRGSR